MEFRRALQQVMELQNEFSAENNSPMQVRGDLVRHRIPGLIGSRSLDLSSSIGISEEDLLVQGSDGIGMKARIPWVRFGSCALAPRPTAGLYVVYLFSNPGDRIYLSLNQGTTRWSGDDSVPRLSAEIEAIADWSRQVLGDWISDSAAEINLGSNQGRLGRAYASGNIAAVELSAAALPEEKQLIALEREFAHALGRLYAEQLRIEIGSGEDEAIPGLSVGTAQRDAMIVDMRGDGATLQSIADLFGISKERVRQISEKAGLAPSVVWEKRKQEQQVAAEAVLSLAMTKWRSGEDPRDIAKALNVSAVALSEQINKSASEADSAARRGAINARSGASSKRYSDEELVAGVRHAASHLGRVPTSTQYAKLSAQLGLPSIASIHNRLTWAGALKAAGFPPPVRRRTYEVKWTRELCLELLAGVAVKFGHIPSYQEYEEIYHNEAGLPSGPTVRNRVGGWTRVRELVAQRLDISSQALEANTPQHAQLSRSLSEDEQKVITTVLLNQGQTGQNIATHLAVRVEKEMDIPADQLQQFWERSLAAIGTNALSQEQTVESNFHWYNDNPGRAREFARYLCDSRQWDLSDLLGD